MQSEALVLIRPLKQSDVPFVMNSYWKDRKRGQVDIDPKVRHLALTKEITRLIESNTVLMAVDVEDHDTIFAYLIGKNLTDDILVIHFAYTKAAFRRLGLQTKLAESLHGRKPENIVATTNEILIKPLFDKKKILVKPELRGI